MLCLRPYATPMCKTEIQQTAFKEFSGEVCRFFWGRAGIAQGDLFRSSVLGSTEAWGRNTFKGLFLPVSQDSARLCLEKAQAKRLLWQSAVTCALAPLGLSRTGPRYIRRGGQGQTRGLCSAPLGVVRPVTLS